MGKLSSIQWTDATWNIARGCTKVDGDCKFCYMYRDSFNGTRYDARTVKRTKGVFNMPLKLSDPHLIFTSSLTDVFHPDIDSYRDEMWDIIRRSPQHIFQILTKRPERINDHLPEYWDEIVDRVWLGTSIGHMDGIHRFGELVVPIHSRGIRFLSLEPLHGPINLGLETQVDMGHRLGDLIDWVIIGGESGHETGLYRYRPAHFEWFDDIIAQCDAFEDRHRIAVFVKQMGTHLSKELKMSDRHGGDIGEFPERFKRREFPTANRRHPFF